MADAKNESMLPNVLMLQGEVGSFCLQLSPASRDGSCIFTETYDGHRPSTDAQPADRPSIDGQGRSHGDRVASLGPRAHGRPSFGGT